MQANEIFPLMIHLGALLYVVCFLFRDQLYLRLLAVASDLVYCIFYYGTVEDPFWAIIYNLMAMTVNIAMILIIIKDRKLTTMSDQDMELFRAFSGISPGDFRRLRKHGTWHLAEEDTVLTTENKPLTELYYVLSGQVEIKKSDREIPISGKHFIGEIAYLQKTPASATVIAKPGCNYISWTHEDLSKLSDKHDGLAQNLAALMSADLAMKVSRA
jgi:hypothetical protein